MPLRSTPLHAPPIPVLHISQILELFSWVFSPRQRTALIRLCWDCMEFFQGQQGWGVGAHSLRRTSIILGGMNLNRIFARSLNWKGCSLLIRHWFWPSRGSGKFRETQMGTAPQMFPSEISWSYFFHIRTLNTCQGCIGEAEPLWMI